MSDQNQPRSAIPAISGLMLALVALGFFTFKDLPPALSRCVLNFGNLGVY